MRELIAKEPILTVLSEIGTTEKAATALRDERTAALVGEIRRKLEQAIADAERPPEEGMSVEEEAARLGLSKWAVYKRRSRARAA